MGFGVMLLVGMMGMVILAFPPRAESAADPPEHFLIQTTSQCYFDATGSEAGSGPPASGPQVRLLHRHIYDRQEYLRFDSARGEFEAVTPLGEPDARDWNSQREILAKTRGAVDYVCRKNYGIYEPFARKRRVQPLVKIVPSESSVFPHIWLICNVDGFWPSKINITWFRNGKEEDESRVFTTDLTRNGDWTFQVAVMLETRPERGDVYACRVEHASFPEPISIQWEPQSDSARSKMWTGLAGFVLGLVFLAPGLILYLKNKKDPQEVTASRVWPPLRLLDLLTNAVALRLTGESVAEII